MDKVFNCIICKEPLGEIDIDAGIFDERYTELVNNHSCKTWTQISPNIKIGQIFESEDE